MEIREPKTPEEFKKYYRLRWKLLREPWDQPRGSERDDLEDKSIHMMALDGSEVIGVGRGHMNNEGEGQIRYMAVTESHRSKGAGKNILAELESRLNDVGAKRIVLNARATAVPFYHKQGYGIDCESHTLFGNIKHFKMSKELHPR